MKDPLLIRRVGEKAAEDPSCFNRLHPQIPFAGTASSGQIITFETRDCIDGQMPYGAPADRLAGLDMGQVHPMTGPVEIVGAEPGDALAVTFVDIEPAATGITMVAPGFGFLTDLFHEMAVMHWHLNRDFATVARLPGLRVPMAAFPGSIGVLPGTNLLKDILQREAELAAAGGIVMLPDPQSAVPAHLFGSGGPYRHEALRTIPPREFGGNMDIRALTVGSTLLLPVFTPGAGLWCGDVHYAQGDGEVCGSAIEMAARVTVRCEVRKDAGKAMSGPAIEVRQANQAKRESYAVTGIPVKPSGYVPPHLAYLQSDKVAALANLSEDIGLAARNALIGLIDWMVDRYGLERVDAYMIASAAADLRIAQVVDAPNCLVTAEIPLDIFSRS